MTSTYLNVLTIKTAVFLDFYKIDKNWSKKCFKVFRKSDLRMLCKKLFKFVYQTFLCSLCFAAPKTVNMNSILFVLYSIKPNCDWSLSDYYWYIWWQLLKKLLAFWSHYFNKLLKFIDYKQHCLKLQISSE